MASRVTHGPKVDCWCCAGEGKVFLTVVLFRVYEAVIAGNDTASKIHEALAGQDGAKQHAINNRLVELVEMGVLAKEKVGRQWVYRRAEGEEEER